MFSSLLELTLYSVGIDENFKLNNEHFKLNILDQITNGIKNSLRQSKKTESYREFDQGQQIASRHQKIKSQRVSELSRSMSESNQ